MTIESTISHEPYLNQFLYFFCRFKHFFQPSEAQIVYLSTTPRHCWKSIIQIWQMAATCRHFANLTVLFKKKLLTPSMASICSSPFCTTKVCFAKVVFFPCFPFQSKIHCKKSPTARHVYADPAAVIFQVRQLRKFFPSSPIHVMSRLPWQ